MDVKPSEFRVDLFIIFIVSSMMRLLYLYVYIRKYYTYGCSETFAHNSMIVQIVLELFLPGSDLTFYLLYS